MLEAIFLGLIQGLTEFLPISSSAHIRIAGELLPGAKDPGAAFTAISQIGTELAVLIYFRRDIVAIAKAWLRRDGSAEARLGNLIIIGSLPIVILGYFGEDYITNNFRSLWLVATTLILFGLILGLADRIGRNEKLLNQLDARDGIAYGFAQSLALIPGVSRSGATIALGRLLGYKREAALRYSFLLALPAVFGSGLFQLQAAITENAS
ncbi:MAG: hypothetical protein RJA71_454, partial [Actinomycetota bacterium]